ncbi:XdhC family protein [bacterium]|nr:XdhC family protein [bacterium]
METAVLDRMIAQLAAGQPMVVSILVETVGSAPQETGAWMALFPDLSQAGTLGGGCVEAEVRKRAVPLLSTGGAQLNASTWTPTTAGTTASSAGAHRSPLVPRGTRSAARLKPGGRPALRDKPEWSYSGPRGWCGCRVHRPPVPRFHPARGHGRGLAGMDGLGLPHFQSDGAPSLRGTAGTARAALDRGRRPRGMRPGRLAARLDFDLTILDDRPDFANRQRFPDATTILVGPIADTLARVDFTPRDYVVLVTRGHKHDEAALRAVIDKSPAYIGMIGSRRKVALTFRDLAEMGVSKARLSQVHAPIGLPIGSRTVEEIAVSIAAQLVAVRAGKDAPAEVPS